MYPIDLIIVYQINRFPQKRQLNVWCLFYTCSWWTPLIIQFLVRCISLWYPKKIALKQQCVLVKSQWTPLNRNETLWNHTSLFPPHVFTALTPCFTTAGFHGGWISWLLAGWCHVRKAGQRAVANVPTNSKRDDVWLRRSFWIDCFMFVMVNHMDV